MGTRPSSHRGTRREDSAGFARRPTVYAPQNRGFFQTKNSSWPNISEGPALDVLGFFSGGHVILRASSTSQELKDSLFVSPDDHNLAHHRQQYCVRRRWLRVR
jgi:hypothetical protein